MTLIVDYWMRSLLAAVLIILVASGLAWAQGATGTVAGTVQDVQGGVVPGATLTIVSETQGTRSAPVVTNATGDFVVPNLAPDTYSVIVEMPSFKTARQTGIVVSSGSRVSVGTITIEIGTTSEVVTVTSEVPLVQATSGERSFTVSTESVSSLPLGNRSYDGLLALAPGVVLTPGDFVPVSRTGGGGFSNFMLDGATAMDPGVNRPASRVSVEAISEVKVQTSAYQAEFGRSSGLQVNAVTKSGTNVFRGALYDVERDSRWNANSRRNVLSGDPKTIVDERDWGFALGGPVGKPGGSNRLFFYTNYERNPRTFNKDEVIRYRMPTAAERRGDFSQSRDNNGNLFPFVKNPAVVGTCSAASQAACFADGGVLGRIPASALYTPGLNVLKWWPEPNLPDQPGVAYNYETRYPGVDLLGYQAIARVDYQATPSLRGSFKFFEYQQPNTPILGTIPGFNDTRQDDYGIWVPGATLNWTVNNSTFVEAAWGANFHHQEGCSVVGGAPNFCRTGNPVNPAANRLTAGLGGIPYVFPDATIIDPDTHSFRIFERVQPANWDGVRLQSPPQFSFGSRIANAPPNNGGPFMQPSFLDTRSRTINATLTKVQGAHTLKTGYYYYYSLQRRGTGAFTGTLNFGNDTNNPLDSGFGFANAALGVFSSYQQSSRWAEGAYTGINHEAFVQDNWRVNRRLTVDYGLRFVHQVPQYDGYLKSSNFLPEKWVRADAPQLYLPGCALATRPCPAANRQALNPATGSLLGANTNILVGTLVPDTGNRLNGVFPSGQGIVETNYLQPALAVAPRFGAAWDVKGNQSLVVRGGGGLFFDRPPANTTYSTVLNPPFTRNVTVRFGNLANMSTTGLATEAPPALTVFEYDQPLPSSVQWNGGVQVALPFAAVVDVAYTGQHSYNTLQSSNLNTIDIGAAFLPANQNLVVANPANLTDPATSLVSTNPELVRYYKGFGSISQQRPQAWRTYHSIQVSINRRFRQGLSFGFYDTIGLYDRQSAPARLQRNADGTLAIRADQARADELLGDNHPQAHVLRASFVWELPKLTAGGSGLSRAAALVANDWSLSGIWNGATGSAYAAAFSYQSGGGNVNLTGSPDFGSRVVLVPGVDPGGCSDDLLRQFNTAAFRGPTPGSDGLESGNGYLKGCFISSLDLAIARSIRIGGSRQLQLRLDLFNALNQAGVTGRNTTMNLNSPADPVTITNLPDAVAGVRTKPTTAGFGVADQFQDPRSAQVQLRLQF